MARKLILIYGPPLAGKSTLAAALALTFADKTAIVSSDHLVTGAIAVPDADTAAELEMAHTQLRLLVANYLKNGYNVVVEGPFIFDRAGGLLNHEAEIDQLVALMRNLATANIIVHLDAPEATLRDRAATAGRSVGADAAIRIAAAYKDRHGVNAYRFDTAVTSVSDIVASLRADTGLT